MHDFLLERVRGIASGYGSIHVKDDVHTNAAFVGSVSVNDSKAVYFQGSNILTDEGNESTHLSKKEMPVFRAELSYTNTIDDAVLFSSHFDSVGLDGSRSNRRRHERRSARSNARVSIQESLSADGIVQPQQRGRGSAS